MKLNLLFLSLLIFFNAVIANAQKRPNSEVEIRYMRPSITYLFVSPKNNKERVIIDSLRKIDIENMFNDHSIDYDYLSDLPSTPKPPGSEASFQEWEKYRAKVREIENKRKILKNKYVSGATNPIVAKWFNRDSDGKFNMDLIAERGMYAATDADALQALLAQVDRRDMIGLELIDKTYIILWEIVSIKTQEEIYRERRSENRDREGYVASYRADAYKLEFGDSVSAVFWQKYWVDHTNYDENKVAKWNDAKFPIKYIASASGEVSSTQPKDPSNAIYLFTRKKSMDELLYDIPQIIQTSASNIFSRTISDFLPRAPVYSTRPLSAKLGTKESLYFDQRFFIYELVLDDDGKLSKERYGVARARKIVNNDTVATGDAEPSIFRQQGGKRIYQGMLLESARDFGIKFNLGYSNVPENKALGGLNFLLNLRMSRAMSGFIKLSGLHLGIGGNINIMSNVKPGIIHINNLKLIKEDDKLSGLTYNFWIDLSKEMYITRRGNVFLNPAIGVGVSYFDFNKKNGEYLSDITDYNEDDWTWSSLMFPIHVGVGVHLSPYVSIELKPGIFRTLGYQTDSGHNLIQSGNKKTYDSEWGFNKLEKPQYLNSLLFNIKFRL